MIYGYVKVLTGGGEIGKRTKVHAFYSEYDRNRAMYEDYSRTFKRIMIGKEDSEGNEMQDKWRFMDALASENPDDSVFGRILAGDKCIQFETFSFK